MEVFFSRNSALLTETLNHPSIFPKVTDDSCKTIEEIELGDDLFIVECHNNGQYLGCFLFEKKSEYHVDAHICLLPGARGLARRFGKMIIKLVFSSTPFSIITALPPASNRSAENVAKKLGFYYVGPGRSFTVNGSKIGSSLYVFHRGMPWA